MALQTKIGLIKDRTTVSEFFWKASKIGVFLYKN